MPDILGFLAPYLAQMGGGGPLSAGQPVYGGEEVPGQTHAAPPPEIQQQAEAGNQDSWRSYLPGLLGTAGSALAGHFMGGQGLAAAGGFAQNYANVRHQDIQRRREEQFRTEKAIGDQAHEMWKKLQGADLSKLPPELSHLAQKKMEFDQKYAQAIAKDGIDSKESSDLIALGSVIQSALPQVQEFNKQATEAAPYSSAISSGSMPPPPGAEHIAELGLPDDQQSTLAGIEARKSAELNRQQYDTPQFNEELGTYSTPRDMVTLHGQQLAAARAANALKATEAERASRDRDRDAQLQATIAHWGAQASAANSPKPLKVTRLNPETGHKEIVLVHPMTGELIANLGAGPMSATTENRADSASAVIQTGTDITTALSNPATAAQLGPVLGRFNTLREFIGNPPPEYASLAGEIESFALANMGVHGMRSAQGANQIKALLDQHHTPESLIATINGLTHFSHNFINAAHHGTSSGGLKPPPTLPGTKPKSDPLGLFND